MSYVDAKTFFRKLGIKPATKRQLEKSRRDSIKFLVQRLGFGLRLAGSKYYITRNRKDYHGPMSFNEVGWYMTGFMACAGNRKLVPKSWKLWLKKEKRIIKRLIAEDNK